MTTEALTPLRRYGQHDLDCLSRGGERRYVRQHPCSCGLADALDAERPLVFGKEADDLGDKIGRAMHEASQVGGPWAPCPYPYNQWPECEHQPMGQHVANIVLGIDNG